MKFTPYELFDLINRPRPLWLAGADLSGPPWRPGRSTATTRVTRPGTARRSSPAAR